MTDEEKKQKNREYQKQYRAQNPDIVKERKAKAYQKLKEQGLTQTEEYKQKKREVAKKYYYAHPDRRPTKEQNNERAAKYRASETSTVKARYFRDTYGITLEQRDEMIKAQDGKCKICGELPAGKGRHGILEVDHDHVTGAVRGLLCHACNVTLGLFGDNPNTLNEAVNYLGRNL